MLPRGVRLLCGLLLMAVAALAAAAMAATTAAGAAHASRSGSENQGPSTSTSTSSAHAPVRALIDDIAAMTTARAGDGLPFASREDFIAAEYYAATVSRPWAQRESPKWDGHAYMLAERDPPDTPLAGRYTAEQQCRVCRMWIHAAVAWLPHEDEFTVEELQYTLKAACNDTWLIHDADLRLERVGVNGGDDTPSNKTWGHKAHCEQALGADVAQEALLALWSLWDDLQPVGGLPDAVCCRVRACGCAAFADERRARFWMGAPAVRPPTYMDGG